MPWFMVGILAAIAGNIALLAHAGVTWVLAAISLASCDAVLLRAYNLTPPSQLKWICAASITAPFSC
jgi:hypothetical protein